VRRAMEALACLSWLSLPISARQNDWPGNCFCESGLLSEASATWVFNLNRQYHKTNQLEWKLFTLIVRDQYAYWHPVAHGLLSHEFGELIAKFLLAVKKWTSPNWPLRYVLSDDSGAEQLAFRLVFPGLVGGETKVRYHDNLIPYLTTNA
jgi:hypothetical protein